MEQTFNLSKKKTDSCGWGINVKEIMYCSPVNIKIKGVYILHVNTCFWLHVFTCAYKVVFFICLFLFHPSVTNQYQSIPIYLSFGIVNRYQSISTRIFAIDWPSSINYIDWIPQVMSEVDLRDT